MSSNFEWQKHQVDERIQGALKEAASHRLGRDGVGRGSFGATFFKVILFLGLAWFLIGALLTALTPSPPATQTIPPQTVVQNVSPWTMANRIRFQDQLWDQALAIGEVKPPQTSPWTMADRIRFQDRLWEQYLSQIEARSDPKLIPQTWSIAD